jgi:hypothetical protein
MPTGEALKLNLYLHNPGVKLDLLGPSNTQRMRISQNGRRQIRSCGALLTAPARKNWSNSAL